MSAQACVVLSTLCLLLSMAPVFCGESASHHTTNETVTTTGYNTSAPESASPTMTPLNTANLTMKAQDMATTDTTKAQSPKKPMESEPTTNTPPPPHSHAGHIVVWLLFFCILFALIYCAYRWYIRHGRPSFWEIRRTVAESARNAWAAVVACLSPSSEEEDEEMEAGEENRQGRDAEDDNNDDDDDDSSDSSSSMGGTMTMVGQKKDEEEDGQRNESENDMTSVKLQDEKPERETNDLTVL